MKVRGVIAIGLVCSLALAAAGASKSCLVRIDKGPEGWRLLVDGRPFWIRGVGCNTATGPKGEDYLLMAKDMGANAVRTWGMVPRSYLDKAQEYGLKVDLGIWLNPIRGQMKDSYLNPYYREQLRSDIVKYVRKMRRHPALLFWNVGNEVFNYTEADDEKQAFGEFLRQILLSIHDEDPCHPVVYASGGLADLPYLKKYVPSLDAVGINAYDGQVSPWVRWLSKNAYDKPFFLSELGPKGPWQMPKDENGMPVDPLDPIKAGDYDSLLKQIESVRSLCLGGFVFVLGDMRNQDSLTWFNINLGELRRAQYWMIYSHYTGLHPSNQCPRIHEFKVDRTSDLHPGERINVKVDAVDPDGDPLTYDYFITAIASDPLVVEPPVYFPTQTEYKSPGVARLQIPLKPGEYRASVSVRDNHRNAAVASRSLSVVPR